MSDFGHWLKTLVAAGVHGEVSDATIQGFLRMAGQIEDIWQQVDDKVDECIMKGMPPWEAYAKMGYALAFVRACRTNVVFVQELLKAGASTDPAHAGYLPKVTYDQAMALCQYIQPYLQETLVALNDPTYRPTTYRLPLELGPRIAVAGQFSPLSHLKGIVAAGRETREWAAGLQAKYELALGAAKVAVPQPVAAHQEEMKKTLSLGDFNLRAGTDMVGQVTPQQVTATLADQAENLLWKAMQGFFLVSQLVANPGSFAQPAPPRTSAGDHRPSRERQPGPPAAARPQEYRPRQPDRPPPPRYQPSYQEPPPAYRINDDLNPPYRVNDDLDDEVPAVDIAEVNRLLQQMSGAGSGVPRVTVPPQSPDQPRVGDLSGLLGQAVGTSGSGPARQIPPARQAQSAGGLPELDALLQGAGTGPGLSPRRQEERAPFGGMSPDQQSPLNAEVDDLFQQVAGGGGAATPRSQAPGAGVPDGLNDLFQQAAGGQGQGATPSKLPPDKSGKERGDPRRQSPGAGSDVLDLLSGASGEPRDKGGE